MDREAWHSDCVITGDLLPVVPSAHRCKSADAQRDAVFFSAAISLSIISLFEQIQRAAEGLQAISRDLH
jgi:hypothetical protein